MHSKDSKSKRLAAMQSKGNNSKNTEQIRVRCTFSGCPKSYSSMRNLNQHINRHHQKQRFECSMCEKILVSSFSLKRHCRDVHQKKIKSTASAEVIVSRNSVKIALKAKNALIIEQATKIEKLKEEYKLLQIVKSELHLQLMAENTSK